ncbi:MAG: uracil-DNA glycosylase, partial [Bacteroidetes bacterium]|nr:uracil-DNA glycosylase [Bacteroidota bacterium]
MVERINPQIEESWKEVLLEEFNKPYFLSLKEFLVDEKSKHIVYPPGNKIFNAFKETPFDKVRVVILGQDPYHGAGQAHGLCFSVPDGIPQPPSLQNIFKEISRDMGLPVPRSGNLTSWAQQGVLLLNATLTVRANQAGSHQRKGWETFTDRVIEELSARKQGLIFLLWGNYAGAKESLIDTTLHVVLKAPHPSPLSASRGFLGCGHFSKVNEILQNRQDFQINWILN